jgi:drug/metabolite transporter (DMT)-like permease
MQSSLTKATLIKKASYIMPFGYISIVFASICDIIIFKISFDWISVIGMVMTSVGLISKLLVPQ